MVRGLVVIASLIASLAASPVFASSSALTLTARDGLQLSGILETPAESPATIALLLPGSGNVGTDGDVSSPLVGSGYRGARAALSEQLASALSFAGIASYRYAKRGFENAAELPHQTFPYLLNDAEDAAELLRVAHPGARLLVVGFSEGALLATHLAARVHVDGLYLLGLPSRPIDEVLAYQFISWPVQLLQDRIDLNRDGLLDANELTAISALPLHEVPTTSADTNSDGALSISGELSSFYEAAYAQIRGLLASPAFEPWYQGMLAAPTFASVAAAASAPVFLYHGAQDPQVNAQWVREDSRYFPHLMSVRIFENAGHAFAPLDGVIGEVKTSGPLSEAVLTSIVSDILRTQ